MNARQRLPTDTPVHLRERWATTCNASGNRPNSRPNQGRWDAFENRQHLSAPFKGWACTHYGRPPRARLAGLPRPLPPLPPLPGRTGPSESESDSASAARPPPAAPKEPLAASAPAPASLISTSLSAAAAPAGAAEDAAAPLLLPRPPRLLTAWDTSKSGIVLAVIALPDRRDTDGTAKRMSPQGTCCTGAGAARLAPLPSSLLLSSSPSESVPLAAPPAPPAAPPAALLLGAPVLRLRFPPTRLRTRAATTMMGSSPAAAH
jgi:hypothetical protein